MSDNPITRLFWAALTGPKGTIGRIAAESFRELSGTALETLGTTLRTGVTPQRTPFRSAEESDFERDQGKPTR
jgi:hypothetical protein